METYIYGKIKTKIMSSKDGYHHLIQHQALTPRHFLQWRGGTNSKISTPAIVSTIGQLPTPMITNSEIHLFHQTQVFFFTRYLSIFSLNRVFFLQSFNYPGSQILQVLPTFIFFPSLATKHHFNSFTTSALDYSKFMRLGYTSHP